MESEMDSAKDFIDFIKEYTTPLSFVGGAIIAAAVYRLFDLADKHLRVEAKDDIRNSLRPIQIGQLISHLPRSFSNIFDAVFGEHHLTYRCFLRSSIASILFFLLIYGFASFINPNTFIEASLKGGMRAFLLIFFGAVILNVIGDYISLLETRFFLKKMTTSRKTFIFLFP